MFAVTVTFRIRPDHRDAFHAALRINAETSREREADCHRFDVCTDPDRPNDVFLYELYENRAAFDEHHETDHFLAFAEVTSPMVADKRVVTFRSVT